jgi:hypothetical protein
MSEILVSWKNEIVAELAEAREALTEAAETADAAQAAHRDALVRVEAVKLALGRLPGIGTSLAQPISGRVAAASAELEVAAMAGRRALLDQREAEARVARLETAADQLTAVLAAAEPEEVAA